jgi:hypothetical protein
MRKRLLGGSSETSSKKSSPMPATNMSSLNRYMPSEQDLKDAQEMKESLIRIENLEAEISETRHSFELELITVEKEITFFQKKFAENNIPISQVKELQENIATRTRLNEGIAKMNADLKDFHDIRIKIGDALIRLPGGKEYLLEKGWL